MKTQHVLHFSSVLTHISETLQVYEVEFEKIKNKNIVETIQDIRYDIDQILKMLGVKKKERDIYKNLRDLCTFFQLDLMELEPKNFQKAYGAFDSKSEEELLGEFVRKLGDKIDFLEKLASENN